MATIKVPDYLFTDSLFANSEKFVWWLSIVRLAAVEPMTLHRKGRDIEVGRGDVITTYGELKKLLRISSNSSLQWFLQKLEESGHIQYNSCTDCVRITISHYEDYATVPYDFRTKSVQNDNVCTISVQPTAEIPTDYEEGQYDFSTDCKKKKKEKRKASPTPPIKEKINKKEKDSTEGHGDKSPCLHTRARKVFEDFYFAVYNTPYYFDAKDAGHLKRLLNKIAYSRKSRPVPLPVDDDSLIVAFSQFLSAINKQWIQNNFSITQISSHYNEIISEIKNRNNNQANGRKQITPKGGASGLEEVCGSPSEKKKLQSTI